MSFLKEFRDDLSQAVNELIPDSDLFDEEMFVEEDGTVDNKEASEQGDDDILDNIIKDKLNTIKAEKAKEKDVKPEEKPIPKVEKASAIRKEPLKESAKDVGLDTMDANDEVTVITKGATVKGNFTTDGSLEVRGTILGDIECLGKLSIIGKVSGNSKAAEIFVNTARLEGSVDSEGTVKIGSNSVLIGNINATSSVIAGAVKGDIDVNGPVIIDSTAVVVGNIQARSVQINNGAVIEGFCSLSYADVDIKTMFDE